ALQGDTRDRDVHGLGGLGVVDEHIRRDTTLDRKRDLVGGGGSRGGSPSIEGALFPIAGEAATAIAETAPDLDLVVVALAADGQTQVGSATGVIGVALDAFFPPLVEADLAPAAPGSEQRRERTRISLGGARGDKENQRAYGSGRKQQNG